MSLGVCWDARLQVLSARFSSLADTFQAKGVCLFAYGPGSNFQKCFGSLSRAFPFLKEIFEVQNINAAAACSKNITPTRAGPEP